MGLDPTGDHHAIVAVVRPGIADVVTSDAEGIGE
jgi:hypothetical protein